MVAAAAAIVFYFACSFVLYTSRAARRAKSCTACAGIYKFNSWKRFSAAC